ncbi:glycosyltransferase family 4 protein [Vibrio vulnificus]|uniref:glycosyltransferase family 4 protein n=1 Tax=Vibrio vulnificus TaxID=672 RepID=UPI000C9E28C0|nr:glycosyltransferase family 4 protein [Vibrio vulnificus]EGR0207336.1 glycosyltransferase family 4 protein [Vibrio vulnificus]EGR0394339.1 glycosyltransferase family 4 protein [Vibrio vulnificus]EHD2236858.1 glycosyltransferase family 4 protein [Vibrio vulnificus]EHH0682387.1 glycosyltransferase family 4 protein [Vibrio vulnificus]EHH1183739.1 glycosyltransferase family 4 protein [Vibrio vulnificus]
MKILVLSFYYKPDLCAGSFRTTALVEQLKQQAGVEVDVVTTMPNRYASFDASADTVVKVEEVDGNARIRRIHLPSHNSGMLDQIKSFKTFYQQAQKLVKNESYDLVFATSSRLFTAFLGARVAKAKKVPLYLDIRDIFVDTIKDVLSPKVVLLLKPVLSAIEKYTFSSANHINLVSKGFEGYFKARYANSSYSWFTNGIDDEFLGLPKGNRNEFTSEKAKRLVYAGNIGEGQGLHSILPALAISAIHDYTFRVIGDGGRKKQLEDSTTNNNNLELLPPVNRQKLIEEYLSADVLFLHLNDYPAFEKVLPSKIFEYAATGKPILAGVSGYASEFIKAEVPNAEVFYPGDHNGAMEALKKLKLEYTGRAAFIEKYTRSNIMQKMSKSIIELGR